jgi:hypothetical protein
VSFTEPERGTTDITQAFKGESGVCFCNIASR